MVARFSDKFGDDENSLKIIHECLGQKLNNRERIEASDLNEIQNEVRRRLNSQNRYVPNMNMPMPPARASSSNQLRSWSALRTPVPEMNDESEDGGVAGNRRAQTKLLRDVPRAHNQANKSSYLEQFDAFSQERERSKPRAGFASQFDSPDKRM
jgi:hypothetical protein